MKQQPLQTTDFGRKPYVKPQIDVVEIKTADILCTSGSSSSSPFVFGTGDNDFGYTEDTW